MKKNTDGLQEGELRFLDAPIQPAFPSGLKLRGRQIQKKLIVVGSALFDLPKMSLKVSSHAGKIQRLEISFKLYQCSYCHWIPPSCP